VISILVLVVALYAAVATAYLEARRRGETPPRWSRAVGAAAVGVHLCGLIALGAAIERSPFHTEAQALSFLAFALAALYLVLEATSGVAAHGGGFYLLATLLSALAVPGLVGTEAGASDGVRDPLRTVHTGLALLGTAAVLASGLLAAGYLAAYARVKRHALPPASPGPSLTGFERLARAASFLGLLLLAPALVLGTLVALRDEPGAAAVVLVAVTGATFLLLAFAGFLWWRRPRLGSVAAWLNVTGTAMVIVAFGLVHPLVSSGAGAAGR
jgi:hypothetical protein